MMTLSVKGKWLLCRIIPFVIIWFAIRRSIASVELIGTISVCLFIVLQFNPTARLHVAIQRWLYNAWGNCPSFETRADRQRQKNTPRQGASLRLNLR